jgi:hypothetical protein
MQGLSCFVQRSKYIIYVGCFYSTFPYGLHILKKFIRNTREGVDFLIFLTIQRYYFTNLTRCNFTSSNLEKNITLRKVYIPMQFEVNKSTKKEMTEMSYFNCACSRNPALKYIISSNLVL